MFMLSGIATAADAITVAITTDHIIGGITTIAGPEFTCILAVKGVAA